MERIYVPKGVAHPYWTSGDEWVVLYRVDSRYAPDAERGLRWDDKTLNIRWLTDKPFLSAKDKALPAFKDFVSPFWQASKRDSDQQIHSGNKT